MTDEKRGRGRPKMSDADKAQNKAWRDAGKDPKAERAKLKAQDKAASKTTEHDRVKLEDLNDDQHFALMMRHAKTISAAEGRLEKIKKDVKAARDLARAELGKDALHEIKLYRHLESDEGQRQLKATMDMQIRMARWSGMAVGHMDDLFPVDRTPLEDATRADGRRAGLAGDDNAAPTHLDMPLRSKWQEGYNEGQAINLAGIKKKAEPETFGAPPAADETDETKLATYWMGMGRVAFEKRHNGEVPDDVPADHREHWTMGYENARSAAKHNGRDYAAEGAAARADNVGCSIPTDLSKADGAEWHRGWLAKDAEMTESRVAA